MAAEALECFRRQTYVPRQLVIVDDREDRSFGEEIRMEPGVKYILLPGRQTIGAKRNIACAQADGLVICHWDSDDLSAPGRIADQFALLHASGSQIVGYHTITFLMLNGERWLYRGETDYAPGTSLMYNRTVWQERSFETMRARNVGEDAHFINGRKHLLSTAPAGDMLIARVHPGQTNETAKQINEARLGKATRWERIS